MRILDTNHLSELERDTELGRTLIPRIRRESDNTYLTVISIEEIMKGRLAAVNAAKTESIQIEAYSKLQGSMAALNAWSCLGWDEDTAEWFRRLRAQGVRIGTLDLRIACIALAYDATLLSRNLKDFHQVPGLRVENWLD